LRASVTRLLEKQYRWSAWAAPKKRDGSFDHDNTQTGKDLVEFVTGKLFPYLQGFKRRAAGPDTVEYKIGEIFGEVKNKFNSGYSLRDALELVDGLRFRSQQEKHELSDLYESRIRKMGNAGRNGGEYYTPRPLIRAMIQVVKPQIGDRIYDGACGSAGFLCESYDYLRHPKDGKKLKATGATATGIKASLLKQVPISFPKLLSEQKALSTLLTNFETETQRLESLYRRKLAALAELKQSLLAQAFAGKLTADPTPQRRLN
jgi:type I restriction-modification system DNA methylase subunit